MAGKKKSAILSVNIVSDANTKGFTEAARAAQKMAADINASTAQAAGMATKIGGLTTGITSLVSIAGGAIGQVAAGATALAAVAGPALGAVVLGFDGIKEAAEGLKEPFDSLKESVSGEFAAALEEPFENLGGLITNLEEPMAGLGASVGNLMGGLVDTIVSNQSELEKLIGAASEFTDAMGPGLNTLLEGVLSIGTGLDGIAGDFGAAFGGVLEVLGEKFQEYASSGATTALIQG